MDEVCAECGSKLDYRAVDVTSLASTSKEFEQVPWRCTNRNCENHDPRFHTFGWTATKTEWDAAHPS